MPNLLSNNDMSYQEIWFMRHAFDTARLSTHPRTQVGCIIVDTKRNIEISSGYNRGVPNLLEEETNHRDGWIHAECAAICKCSSSCHSSREATMYSTWACCALCAVHIIEAGITNLVTTHKSLEVCHERWKETITNGLALLEKNNVNVSLIDFPLNEEIRFNGETHVF